MIGNLISILFSQWATTSSSHSLCDLTGSTDKVATKQSSASSSSYLRARRPISVVQTGVKSAGWENRIAHLPFFHSWKDSKGPWVVSAPKSGTIFPRRIAVEKGNQWDFVETFPQHRKREKMASNDTQYVAHTKETHRLTSVCRSFRIQWHILLGTTLHGADRTHDAG